MLKLGPLLSIDNHARRAAENEFERLRRENPTVVAGALITTLNQAGGANEAERELAAVLARRVIPTLLPKLPADAVAAVKSGLLQALVTPCSASMHRK